MNESTINEIKERCSIVDIVGRAVPLKRAGSNYKGLCPFHSEKTPSFVVSESHQRFTCFGCGASGDVIEFMKRYYNMDFVQAVEKLAEEVGVTIETGYGDDHRRKELLEINRQAAIFFYKAMRSGPNPGWDYMAGRGIDAETLKTFGIGYADGRWDSLYRHLKSMGYDERVMLELGLISGSDGKYFDKYRDRVMFPIWNTGGKVIGFGGRAIGDAIPKYLNSRESSLFKKKDNLYALNLTRGDIGKNDQAILVEGYMDVISLYQHGVRNVSASLGTALTPSQARLIKRYTDNVVLSYDADAAGVAAALRGMDILYKEGCKVRVLHVTDGKDPDEFVRARGKDAFLQLASEAPTFAEYKLDRLRQQVDPDRTDQRVEFLRRAADVLRQLGPVEQDLYLNRLAEEEGISPQAIRAEIARGPSAPAPRVRRAREKQGELTPLEKTMIKVLLTESSYLEHKEELDSVFTTDAGDRIRRALEENRRPGQGIDEEALRDRLVGEDQQALEQIRANIRLGGKTQEIFDDCVRSGRSEKLKEKMEDLQARLAMIEDDDSPMATAIMEQIRKVQEEQKGITHGETKGNR